MVAPINNPTSSSRYLTAVGLLGFLVILSLLSGTRETSRFQTDQNSRGGGARRTPLYRSRRKKAERNASHIASLRGPTSSNDHSSSVLDIAIVGFPRSGATLMQQWLRQSDDIYMDEDDMTYLSHGNVEGLVEHFSKVNKQHPTVQNAIKFPYDIDTPKGLHTLKENFPNTKLIVMLRHPVLQFESLYNHQYQTSRWYRNGRFSSLLEHPSQLVGSCRHDHSRYSCINGGSESVNGCKSDNVCTDRSKIHHAIARLGLTPMTSETEMMLLGGKDFNMSVHPWNMPVLFVEMNQLLGEEGSPSSQFHQDVQSFLGVSHLPERIQNGTAADPLDNKKLVVDICSQKYTLLRKILQHYAKRSSKWILQYLLQSELAAVSNRTQFIELVQQWQLDPCENRNAPPTTSRLENLVKRLGASTEREGLYTGKRRHSDRHQQGVVENYKRRKRLGGKDVRDILHFAIIGFPKCGTTSMMRWIRSSPSVYMGDNHTKEISLLTNNVPLQLTDKFLAENPDYPRVKNGIKFPGDIDSPYGLNNMVKHYNKTKLIVMVRHPVLWFESFYNFRNLKIPPHTLIGSCRSDGQRYGCTSSSRRGQCKAGNVCTDRALFHQAISRLGLTPMDTMEELELLGTHNMTMHNWTHPVMFVEINQLKADNVTRTRTDQLHDDLSSFLNLTDLPPMDLTVYNKHQERRSSRDRTLDICSESHRIVHSVLMDYAKSASRWIRKYLLTSELAVVSSRDHFMKLVEDWENDPCEQRRSGILLDATTA